MADYCLVYGVIHFTSPAGCTPGSAPGPTLGNEYGKTLPLPFFYHTTPETELDSMRRVLKRDLSQLNLPHGTNN